MNLFNDVTRTCEGNEPECFASEKGVEPFAVCHMVFASKEDPKSGAVSTEEIGAEIGDFYQLSGKRMCLAAATIQGSA
jgi:hypothetical protein